MPYNLRIPGRFTERELWAIEAMAKSVPPGGVVVEVGSYLGLSSYAWAKSVDPSVTVYCIDAWEEDGEYAQKWQEKYQIDYSLEKFHEFTQTCSNIVVLKGFSHHIFTDWDKSIDVYFQNIDRQHTVIGENISLWSQFVKVDGLICGYGYGGEFPCVIDEVRKLANLYGVEPVIVEKIWCLTTGVSVNKLNTITKINDIHGYEYELNLLEPPALLEPGDLLKVSGKLKNISGRDWDIFVDNSETIKIGIQVYEENKPGRQEFRSSLGVDKFVDGATIEFECLIDTKPLKQGKIRLVFDVVAECYYWFEEKGAKPKIITVQILPRTAGNLIKIGNQLKREGKLAEAILEYRQAIELNPNFSWAYYNLGDALVKKGYVNEAIGKYKKAIELNCDSYFLFYHDLGIALHTQGKIDPAINCFKKAKQLLKSKDNLTRQKYKYLRDSFLAKARLSLSGQSTYLSKKFTDLINPDSINYILEIGSRDGIDAVYLSKYYLCQVDAFECNPESIEICLNNLRAYTNINLVTKAVWDRNETISFYVTTNGNIGASSCFEETGDYPFEKYNPYQISVEAIRLDSYLKRSPDLICMDLQGAELNALKGLGEFLKGVKYIITELEVKPLYKNQCLFDDVVEFLKEWGFELQKYIPVYHKWFGDALFVNKSLVKIPLLTERMTNVNYNLSINLQQHESKIFSQNGEDGVIKKIFEVIKTTNKYYVEFGVENANECNTRNLRENCGWSGLLMDGGYQNKEIGLYQEFITAENINDLFRKYNVPQEFDLLSIDIDYNNFYVWKSLDEIYQPRVVIIEYNASHLPTEDKVVTYDANAVWDETNYFGASIRALYNLGKRKGYSLIYANNQGVNLFFVKSSILSKIEHSFKDTNNIFLIYNSPKYGSDISGGHRRDDKNREYITSEEILST